MKKVFIVSHTHWDREWYQTFHQFRVDMVRIIDRVLNALDDDPTFHHFLLDGQAILLEDYLEVRPHERERLRRLVAGGALSVGPWYILPDEFLISAESTVRNLLLGHLVARKVGEAQKVGYMPDSFGHVAQVPQILRQAGIDSFVYTRGNGDEIEQTGYEYLWRAPDGSEVLAINQCDGYCNAGGLGFEELWHAHTRREVSTERAVTKVRGLLEKMRPLSRGDVALLNNGCDHFPPQQEFGRVLAALNEAFPETEFVHTDLREYVDAVRRGGFAKRSFGGELVSGKLHHILSGVWSARMYLKQQNDSAQNLLSGVLEPASAYSRFVLGEEYPAQQIEYAWKTLLQNHPHDSICGCSIDEVHRDMLPRFDGVLQTGDQLLRHQLERIAPTFARQPEADRSTAIAVFNPLPRKRTEVVERIVVLQPLGYDVDRLRLIDEAGRSVPFRILDRRYLERFWGIDYRRELFAADQQEKLATYLERFGERIVRDASRAGDSDCFLTLQFLAEDLPAVGHARYFLVEDASGGIPDPGAPPVRAEGDVLENELLRVRLHGNGTFDLEDKRSGREYTGLNLLEDTEDIGDEYDYCPAERTRTLDSSSATGDVCVVESGGWSAALESEFVLRLPERIAADRTRRGYEPCACAVRVRIALRTRSPVVEIETTFDNRANDHRLRAVFPSGVASDTVVSDGHYYINRRPIRQPDGDDWVQPPPGTFPQQDWSLVEDGGRGLAVLNRGLPEIAAMREDSGNVALHLTLLRCVDWLSRDDFPTRRHSNAGPTLYTPEAQCPGTHRFRYAVVPFEGDAIAAGIPHESRRWRTPVLTIQGVEDCGAASTDGLVGHTSAQTQMTAIKRHEERDSLVVRLYNLTAEPVRDTLQLGFVAAAAWRTNLLEQREAELSIADGRVIEVELGPHRIVTLEIRPQT
ncbi:MAG: hypothetical protein GY716_02775 [bacterium]|nr:hypothetical protein [bacterium]